MHLHEKTTRERVLKLNEAEIVAALKAHYELEDWDSYVLTLDKQDQGCGHGFKAALTLRMRTDISPKYHTVIYGDTLLEITNQYGLTLDEISKINPQIQNHDLIQIGQKIRVS